ncbi:hypothetical protein C8R46DRAFT_287235 [Mycena filopes]|nr:hypothetical protein C8R46DRAFT_287235 [Mycena filopes]
MSANNSYYREHTRQQDGWTVLTPPPDHDAELPPPYTAEDDPVAAAAVPVAPAPSLPFEIPTNSNIIGVKVPVTKTKKYERNIAFAVAFPEICNIMGLDTSHARIGYKWDNERANAGIHHLSNAADWTNCLDNGLGMQRRARVRTVVCVIKNLNLPEETAPEPAPATSSSASHGKKRKSSANSPDGKHRFDYTQDYRLLKKELECATHKGQLCYVSNVDGHHKDVDREHASLWAKEIKMGNASFKRPPENIMFQDYFLPAPKRRNTRDNRVDPSTNSCIPAIHVTVNTGPGGAGTSTSSRVGLSPPRPHRSPLSTITAATANANNIPSSLHRPQPDVDLYPTTSSHDVRYPTVMEVLQTIDDSGIFADSAELDFPVVVFADDLAQSQITHVDHVPLLNSSFYVDIFNMPPALAELFVEESIAAMGRAQKGKGRID